MPDYKAPNRDQKFVLNELLNVQQYSDIPGFADASEDIVNAILEEGGKFCEGVLHPLNKVGDHEGCRKFFDEYRKKMDINIVSFNTVCASYGKSSNLSGARAWVDYMRACAYVPDTATYKSVFAYVPPVANFDALCHV